MERRRFKEKHPKVRTGCLTCKARHVKCDENRPVCVRCRKGGYKCEGYVDPPKAWVFEYSQDSDRSAKEDTSSNDQSETSPKLVATSNREPTAPTSEEPSDAESSQATGSLVEFLAKARGRFSVQPGSPYRTPDEQRAIKRFFEVTGPMLCRYSDPEVWLVGIPQSAWDYSAVRHSLIAATLVNEETDTAVRRAPRNGKILVHLNLALRAMLSEKPPLEVVLITALVLQLAETLNHNASTALIHLRSARKILNEFKLRAADGERVNTTQTDFILGRLEPVITVAEQFAEATLDRDINKSRIDQHSADAYALREKLTRPGFIDSFRDLRDARNSLGSQAVQLAQSMASNQRPNTASKAVSTTDEKSWGKLPPQLSQQEYAAAEARRDHFRRLFQPIYQEKEPFARVLHVHFEILKMMLDDVKPHGMEPGKAITWQVEDVSDEMLPQMISLITNASIQKSEDLKIELGLIPPLFYLATTTRQFCYLSRRRAIQCLQNQLGERREGAWSGAIAARIAEEIVDVGVELSSKFIIVRVQFEVFDRFHDSVHNNHSSSMRKKDGAELWISYDAVPTMPCPSDKEAVLEVKTRARRCITWTAEEINRLPKNINELVRNAGYQGYFSDALAATTSVVSTM